MGASAGLTLRKVGGDGMLTGNWRAAAWIAACTSSAAPSISRSRSNWMVMRVEPATLCDVIEETPGMVENCDSSGVATALAIVSGIGARQAGRDADGGEIHRRQFADRQRRIAEHAENHQRRHQQHRHHRAFDEGRGDVHGSASLGLGAGWPLVMRTRWPGVTRSWPSVTTLSPGFTSPCDGVIHAIVIQHLDGLGIDLAVLAHHQHDRRCRGPD